MVMHVSKFVRWIRVSLVFKVIATMSRRTPSAFFAALVIASLSVFAAKRAAYICIEAQGLCTQYWNIIYTLLYAYLGIFTSQCAKKAVLIAQAIRVVVP